MKSSVHLRTRLDNLLDQVETSSNSDLQEDVAWMISNIPAIERSISKDYLMLERPNLSELMKDMKSISRKKAIVVLQDYAKRLDLEGQVADVLLQIINFNYNEPEVESVA